MTKRCAISPVALLLLVLLVFGETCSTVAKPVASQGRGKTSPGPCESAECLAGRTIDCRIVAENEPAPSPEAAVPSCKVATDSPERGLGPIITTCRPANGLKAHRSCKMTYGSLRRPQPGYNFGGFLVLLLSCVACSALCTSACVKCRSILNEEGSSCSTDSPPSSRSRTSQLAQSNVDVGGSL